MSVVGSVSHIATHIFICVAWFAILLHIRVVVIVRLSPGSGRLQIYSCKLHKIQISDEGGVLQISVCDPWLRPRALRLVSGPRRRSGRSVIDREMAYVLIVKGYCHGSRKDRGNKYTASDGLGVFAKSPETTPSRNTLERGGSKDDRLKVAISLLGALGTIYTELRETDLI